MMTETTFDNLDNFVKAEKDNLTKYFSEKVMSASVKYEDDLRHVRSGSSESFEHVQMIKRSLAREIGEYLLENKLIEIREKRDPLNDTVTFIGTVSVCPSEQEIRSVIREAVDDLYAIYEEL